MIRLITLRILEATRPTMQITSVQITLADQYNKHRLLAYASVVFDNCFCVQDIKVIDGTKGIFLAMPSRPVKDTCPECHSKNPLLAHYCNKCGYELGEYSGDLDCPECEGRSRVAGDNGWEKCSTCNGRIKLYSDVCFPLNRECRAMMEREVLAAYDEARTVVA